MLIAECYFVSLTRGKTVLKPKPPSINPEPLLTIPLRLRLLEPGDEWGRINVQQDFPSLRGGVYMTATMRSSILRTALAVITTAVFTAIPALASQSEQQQEKFQ